MILGQGPAGVAGPSHCLRPQEEDEMRRTSSTCQRMVLLGFGVWSAAAALGTAPAFGQLPQPHIPDIQQRSGLLDRFIPIEPHLPHDKDRDDFYTTRWGDKDE